MSGAALDHLVIHASAGSGKTHQLTSRYLALLFAGARPRSILTSTFTRKAAGEILRRVLVRLARAAEDRSACEELARELDHPGLTPASAAAALRVVVDELAQLQITTLDALFARILSCFGLDLGLPPGWRIVEDVEEEDMQAEALRRVLSGSRAPLIRLVRRLDPNAARRAITPWLHALSEALHDLYVETPGEAWRTLPRPDALDPPDLARALTALDGASPPPSRRMREAWRKDLARARAGDWLGFARTGLARAIETGDGLYHGRAVPDVLVERYRPLLRHARATLLQRLADQTESTHDVLREVDGALEQLKRHRAALGFADVIRALDGAAALDRLEDVFYRLDGRIEHLLLDEFQDTGRAQWRVLRGLAQELASYGDGSHTLFCVGDVKQAIYGWRGAEPGILEALPREIPSLTRRSLHRTWRSSPPVVDAVNRVFSTLPQNPALSGLESAARIWDEQFTAHDTVRREEPGYVRLEVAPRGDLAQDQPIRTLVHAADVVRQLHAVTPELIGVLVRTRAAVARLRYELHRRGIAASEEGGNPLTDAPAVSLVLSLLHLADHPGDTVARFHVTRSPWSRELGIGASDTDETVARFAARVREQLLADGYGRTLHGWTRQLAAFCDARNLDRLLQLVELGHEHDRGMTLRPADFVRLVRRRDVEDPSSSQVRLMTIHQAKGLEFGIVVLPQLGVDLVRDDTPVLVDRADPVAAPRRVIRATNSTVRAMAGIEDLHRSERQRLARESLNLLYVAMTRAIHALHLVVDPSPERERRPPARLDTVLRAALSKRPGALAAAEPEAVLFENGDPRWYERLRRPGPSAETPAAGDLSPIRLPEAPRGRRRGWSVASASRLGGEGPGTRRLRRDEGGPRIRGLVLHACLAQVAWLDQERPDPAVLRAAAARAVRGEGEPAPIEPMVTEFLSLLEAPNLNALLRRGSYESRWTGRELTLWRERDFLLRRGDTLMQGRYDRVVLGVKQDRVDRAHLIEFKTERLPSADPAAVARAAMVHREQLEACRAALAQRLGLPGPAIRASLVFVTDDALYDWPASGDGEP